MRYVILGLSFWAVISAQAQTPFVSGTVTEKGEDGFVQGIPSANVFWLGSESFEYTDAEGNFKIQKSTATTQLVFRASGFKPDTIETKGLAKVNVQLVPLMTLSEVEVVGKQRATEISYIDPLKIEKISEDELRKAACCNLSESFETSPSVDVSFTDAVTGTRQIQMLGLSGPYIQITRENMPNSRGLSGIYGLEYIPGVWVESIQLNKGTGSVVNGPESMVGQINVELRKPEEADKLYLNLFANQMGRVEANANWAQKLKNEKWSTAILLHGKRNTIEWDQNEDGFMDNPLSNHFFGLNRWKFIGQNGLMFQTGVKYISIDNVGGEMGYDPDAEDVGTELWGMQFNTERIEGWAKLGKVFEEKPWVSTALQLSASSESQNSNFGMNSYDAEQTSFYANYIFQSIKTSSDHQFRVGASFQYDDFDETLNATNYLREEIMPGAFTEYTFKPSEKLTVVAGLRGDIHNLYGAFVTPRLHTRLAITEKTILRLSGGRGQRTNSVIAENVGVLASSRQIEILGEENDLPYGLNAEVAWNYGLSLTQYFRWGYRDGTISLDAYRTDFQNQIVVDMDHSPQTVRFYNLDGQSYSNSFQVRVDYEMFKRFDVRLAYRWFDVQTAIDGELQQKPLLSAHRAFLNLAYETYDKWRFDWTINWQGEKRLPVTESNPEEFQLDSHSPSFILMNAQVSKNWKNKFEVYIGMENLLNFRQESPILASNDPFGNYFDASMVWGPIFGRNTYLGLRYWIK